MSKLNLDKVAGGTISIGGDIRSSTAIIDKQPSITTTDDVKKTSHPTPICTGIYCSSTPIVI